MLSPLEWTTWALAVSHLMTETSASHVSWEDLMIATSKFPRFFGSPAIIARTDPPKVTGVSFYNDVLPLHCSSDSGNFSCAADCKTINCGHGAPYDDAIPAFSAPQERRSSLSHHLDGLEFAFDQNLYDYCLDNHTRQSSFFSQILDGLIPVDNTLVVLGLVSQ
jgi:hypothetical protein